LRTKSFYFSRRRKKYSSKYKVPTEKENGNALQRSSLQKLIESRAVVFPTPSFLYSGKHVLDSRGKN
jgi:hypothetical protein